MLTESVVLSSMGGALGLLLAWWGVDALVRALPAAITFEAPRAADISLNPEVLIAAVAISMLCGIGCGIAPALRSASTDVMSVLRDGDRTSTSARGRRMRDLLVAGELALATVLLVASVMSTRSFLRFVGEPLGYDPSGVLVASLELPVASRGTDAEANAFVDALVGRATALPAVTSVAIASDLPAQSRGSRRFVVEGHPSAGDGSLFASVSNVSPQYFEAAGTRLRAGRTFAQTDLLGGPGVAVVSESLARRCFGNASPLGQRLRWPDQDRSTEIVGVVEDVRDAPGSSLGHVRAYLPYAQEPSAGLVLLVRARGDVSALAGPIRARVEALDPSLPITRLDTLESWVAEERAPLRFIAVLLGLLAALALVLAAIGTYSVMTYAVAQRTQELAIRMALGATPREVVRLVLRSGLVVAVVGLAVGGLGSVATGRIAAALLYGADSFDLAAYGIASALLFTCALVACYLPARRATRVDPLVALRSD